RRNRPEHGRCEPQSDLDAAENSQATRMELRLRAIVFTDLLADPLPDILVRRQWGRRLSRVELDVRQMALEIAGGVFQLGRLLLEDGGGVRSLIGLDSRAQGIDFGLERFRNRSGTRPGANTVRGDEARSDVGGNRKRYGTRPGAPAAQMRIGNKSRCS